MRTNVMLSAVVERFGGGATTTHRVRDLSSGGVRIDRADGLQAGSTVLITVGALCAVGATVRWVCDGSAGLAFAEPVDPEAARARAVIAPRAQAKAGARPVVMRDRATGAGAGWIGDLDDPYRK